MRNLRRASSVRPQATVLMPSQTGCRHPHGCVSSASTRPSTVRGSAAAKRFANSSATSHDTWRSPCRSVCGVAPRALVAAPPGRPSGTSRRGSPVSDRRAVSFLVLAGPSALSPGHMVPRTEQVYDRGWTVAEQADLGRTTPTDWPPPSGFPLGEFASTGRSPGRRRKTGGQRRVSKQHLAHRPWQAPRSAGRAAPPRGGTNAPQPSTEADRAHAAISEAALRVADELRRDSSPRDGMDAEDMHNARRGGFRISVTVGSVPSDVVAAGRGGARRCR